MESTVKPPLALASSDAAQLREMLEKHLMRISHAYGRKATFTHWLAVPASQTPVSVRKFACLELPDFVSLPRPMPASEVAIMLLEYANARAGGARYNLEQQNPGELRGWLISTEMIAGYEVVVAQAEWVKR